MTAIDLVSSRDARAVLDSKTDDILALIAEAYRAHASERAVNPHSLFLRFPEQPQNRIIALPAYLAGEDPVAGVKWISSFPDNTRVGLPRASAVIVLNDMASGRACAVVDGTDISSARTGASAALALSSLREPPPRSIGFVGGGVIARSIARFISASHRLPAECVCFDTDTSTGHAFVEYLGGIGHGGRYAPQLDQALGCDVVVFATTAAEPYVPATFRFAAHQIVLNISLRDLAPETVLAANNVVDDVEHCLRADTSAHLAEKLSGSRDFVTGTIADALNGDLRRDAARSTIISPFGLGILDIALAQLVVREALNQGRSTKIDRFFD